MGVQQLCDILKAKSLVQSLNEFIYDTIRDYGIRNTFTYSLPMKE
jgi:hypothetical protein